MSAHPALWLVLGGLLATSTGCDEDDECIRQCDRRYPHDGSARAACQLDCSQRRGQWLLEEGAAGAAGVAGCAGAAGGEH